MQDDFRRVLNAANLPHTRFDDLRHSAAGIMLNPGVPALVVSKIVGHSNPSIALGIYAHSMPDMQNTAQEAVFC